MMNLDFKKFITFAITMVVTIFSPISNAIWVLTMMSFVDGIAGYRCARKVRNEEFSISKAMTGIGLYAVYLTAVFILYNVAMMFDDEVLAKQGSKWLCYVVCFYYALNILKNLKQLYPMSKVLAFLYDLLSLDILPMIMEKFGLNNLKSVKKYEENNQKNGD